MVLVLVSLAMVRRCGGERGEPGFPPALVMIGEHDMAMQRRDFEELVRICKFWNGRSEGMVLNGAWHNHGVDVPGLCAETARWWGGRVL